MRTNLRPSDGLTKFLVSSQIQEGTTEDASEPATLVLRRSNFELRRNSSRKLTINEKYSPDVLVRLLILNLLAHSALFFLMWTDLSNPKK